MIKTEGDLIRCHFDGSGDILVGCAGHNGKTSCVFLAQDKQNGIGTEHPQHIGKQLESVNARVVLQFEKPESVQIVIDYLQVVKQELEVQA